jgi:hypothetical protein
MNYLSGAIENPTINRAIVNILEGTMPAFHNRQDKYFPLPHEWPRLERRPLF